jgi:hypothetical protein
MASSVNNSAWLEWMSALMGGESRQSYAATLPPDRFYCLLDELPLHLIPRHARAALRLREGQHEPLFLNPDCTFCSSGELPDELVSEKELLAGFVLDAPIAWVRHPDSRSLLPFWLGPRLEELLRGLRANEDASAILPKETRFLLSAAGVVVPAGYAARHHREWEDGVKLAAPRFREKGYAPLANLIHPFHIAALRRYYRHLIRTGKIRLGDGQSPRRYVAYNEPVARFFHRQIVARLSTVAGDPLKPSYVYMASYLSGAELKKHTDREQCEFSVTLCLDFSPEPALETPWPIRLDTPGGTVTVHQALGDGLAYRGTRVPHYRNVLAEGQTSTSIFFHYVPANFAGSLD